MFDYGEQASQPDMFDIVQGSSCRACEHRAARAVQRYCLVVTEFALQHLMSEVRRLIARGIPEPANV